MWLANLWGEISHRNILLHWSPESLCSYLISSDCWDVVSSSSFITTGLSGLIGVSKNLIFGVFIRGGLDMFSLINRFSFGELRGFSLGCDSLSLLQLLHSIFCILSVLGLNLSCVALKWYSWAACISPVCLKSSLSLNSLLVWICPSSTSSSLSVTGTTLLIPLLNALFIFQKVWKKVS